jgi:hypothetical protein
LDTPLEGDQRLRGAFRAWLPATVVAGVLIIGLGAAAYFTFGRGSVGASPSPIPSVEIHSKEAVIAAVKHYYAVTDKARETGDVNSAGSVTTGPGTPAFENFKEFVRQEAAKNRRSVTVADRFGDWNIQLAATTAVAQYSLLQRGHDIDIATGKAVEADQTTTKGFYSATLNLVGQSWLLFDKTLLHEEPS